MPKTLLRVVVDYGQSNGFMTSDWYVDELHMCRVSGPDIDKSTTQLEMYIDLPCTVKMITYGKNLKTDTRVENGQIVSDKYWHIKSMYLAQYPINTNTLQHKLSIFTPQGEEPRPTALFYQNGSATFDFCENDALLWHLKHNDFHQW
jgi:hypothetical protein